MRRALTGGAAIIGALGAGAVLVRARTARPRPVSAQDRAAAEARVLPVALAVLDEESLGGLTLAEALPECDQAVLVDQLLDVGRHLTGGAAGRLRLFMESRGLVDEYVTSLRHRDRDQRADAARALGVVCSERSIGPLIAALIDPDAEVRGLAATALGRIGAAVAAEPLLAGMADETLAGNVAVAALLAIGPQALPAVRSALGSSSVEVRCAAVTLLGSLGDPAEFDLLGAHLREPSAAVRAQAAAALGQLGDPRAIGLLRAALGDRIAAVVEASAAALYQLDAVPLRPGDELGWAA